MAGHQLRAVAGVVEYHAPHPLEGRCGQHEGLNNNLIRRFPILLGKHQPFCTVQIFNSGQTFRERILRTTGVDELAHDCTAMTTSAGKAAVPARMARREGAVFCVPAIAEIPSRLAVARPVSGFDAPWRADLFVVNLNYG